MKIFIENYKNISNLELSVPDSNRFILLGANGVGKTNTLEAIYYGKCSFSDVKDNYADRFLLTMDFQPKADYYYPNKDLIRELFPMDDESNLNEMLMQFLQESYDEMKMPLMKKLISDALASMNYARINKRFDASPLAITRLVILNRIYQRAKQRNERYIILIDDPELYAHPLLMDEITTIILKLEETGSLVVVSTHSNHIISRLFVSFDEIVKLEKDENNALVAKTIDIDLVMKNIRDFYQSDENLTHNFSRPTHPDTGIQKLLEHDLEGYLITAFRDHIIQALFYKVMILGEGASEDVLFDYIENMVHPNWASEYRVGFISCLGKSTLPLYFIFLNTIGVKTFVIYDYDNDNNPVHVAYREGFDRYYKENRKLFHSYYLKPNLEGYLNINQKVESIMKPINIYNYTYIQRDKNKALGDLINIMKENVISLCGGNQ
ncbi:MAG: hypothetical protein IJ115_03605 [Erysipelotrichaceae bacterium]|nr:hypothetical protein [Erysipelotrichaceae bacterium]